MPDIPGRILHPSSVLISFPCVRWSSPDTVKIIAAVKIHPDYGDDHPLVDAMGFVRDSERKSGLTRKKEPKPVTN